MQAPLKLSASVHSLFMMSNQPELGMFFFRFLTILMTASVSIRLSFSRYLDEYS